MANLHSLHHTSTLPAGASPEATQAGTGLGPRPPASWSRVVPLDHLFSLVSGQIVPAKRVNGILRKQFKKKDTPAVLTLRRVKVLSSVCFSN